MADQPPMGLRHSHHPQRLIQALCIALAAAQQAPCQWSAVWPSEDNPRAGEHHYMQAASAVVERCWITGQPYPDWPYSLTDPWTSAWVSVGAGQYTNSSGWIVKASGSVSNGSIRLVGDSEWIRSPLRYDLAEVAITARIITGNTPDAPWQIQGSHDLAAWTTLASVSGPTSATAHASSSIVLAHGFPYYRVLINTFRTGFGYSTIEVQPPTWESMLLRDQRAGLAALKAVITDLVPRFIDPTAAVGIDLSAALGTNVSPPYWTVTGLLAVVNAPTNWPADTPHRLLSSDSNGWTHVPAILSQLVWTASIPVWEQPTNAFNVHGLYGNWNSTNWADAMAAHESNYSAVPAFSTTDAVPASYTFGLYDVPAPGSGDPTNYDAGHSMRYNAQVASGAATQIAHATDFYLWPSAPSLLFSGPILADSTAYDDNGSGYTQGWQLLESGPTGIYCCVTSSLVGPTNISPYPPSLPAWSADPTSSNDNVTARGWSVFTNLVIYRWNVPSGLRYP